jgi:hypothetical protein
MKKEEILKKYNNKKEGEKPKLLSLQEYTTIAEKIVFSSFKKNLKFKIDDEIICEIVREMIYSDMIELDQTKSEMNREQLRRQACVFSLRRYLFNKKFCREHTNLYTTINNRQPFDKMIKEEDLCDLEWKKKIAIENIEESNLNKFEKESIKMLIDGTTIKDISKKNKTSQKKTLACLEDSLKVYHTNG